MTYSQLDLGDGYRLNSRQSNPNIGEDLEHLSSKYKNYKSAPATPRATTPTRIRSKNRAMMNGSNKDPASPPSVMNNGHQTRPMTATSIYSQDTTYSGYPDENASSWDSRSLGRDSALGPYMSAASGYGRPNNGLHSVDTPDRPNPFIHGSSIASEADNVVQMFLMNMNPNVSRRPPGRIEDLPSPTAAVPMPGSLGPSVTSNDPYSTEDRPDGNGVPNKTVLAQLRKDFFARQQQAQSYEKPEQTPKTNKYLRPENRWSKSEEPKPEMTTVVQGFVAPLMHHAEVVHVRQDSTSTEASGDTPVTSERNFEDQAFSNFKAEQSYDYPQEEKKSSPIKKKGFLASIFKKSSGRKGRRHSYYSDDDPIQNDSLPPQEPIPPEFVQDEDLGHVSASEEVEEMPKLLPRKRSMSKPTDLDEILKMQEAMEREQNVAEVFANDPFFQSTLAEYNIDLAPSLPPRAPPTDNNSSAMMNASIDEPIYENQHQISAPSLETTQEIDVDAVLGYSDEKAIQNIEWPSQETIQPSTQQPTQPTQPSMPQPQESFSNHLEIDYAKPAKARKGFFNFGKKSKPKPGKNDEVSYYIEEPQPEPPSDLLEQVPTTSEDERPLSIHEAKDLPVNSSSKPGFFKFKGKKDKSIPDQISQDEKFEIEAETANPTASNPSKPSFFKLRGKSKDADRYKEELEAPIEDFEKTSFVQDVDEPVNSAEVDHYNSEDSRLKEAKSTSMTTEIGEEEKDDTASDEMALGPIREEKPSFVTQISAANTSSDSEARNYNSSTSVKRPKKFGGFSSLFKSSSANLKSGRNNRKNEQIGTMAPVDVSHLVDDDEVIEMEAEIEEENKEQTDPDQLEDERPPSPDYERVQQERGRARPRQKSGGFSNFFGPAKPRSRPSSQSRPSNQFIRDNKRARSLPRQKSKPAGGGGLSDFFGVRAPSQASLHRSGSGPIPPRDPSVDGEQPQPPGRAESRSSMSSINRSNQRPPSKSKSMSGLFSLSTMQPKHSRRRPVEPPPSPPATVQAPAPPTPASEKVMGSQSSLASRHRRDSKGLSNFLNSSPLRKSNRMPRSSTFPRPEDPQQRTKPQQPQQPQNRDQQTTRQNNTSAQPHRESMQRPSTASQPENVDKIEIADEVNETKDSIESGDKNSGLRPPQPQQQQKVMGRRSGRFRRQNSQTTPSQLKGPHTLPPSGPPGAAPGPEFTEQSLTRDLFAETVNRSSSRRGSQTSLHQPKESTETLPPDTEYEQAIHNSTTTKVGRGGRNNSYKMAKGEMESRPGVRNYNSLPRLGGRKNQQSRDQSVPHPRQNQAGSAVTSPSDPETRSLGDQRQQRRQQRRGQQQRGNNDNCQMM